MTTNMQLPPPDLTPWGMFQSADIVVKVVMIGLLVASVVTWTILVAKGIEVLAAKRSASRAFAVADGAPSLDGLAFSGAGSALAAAARMEIEASSDLPADGIKERIAVRLLRIEAALGRRMARGISLLASIGATAPFVGLFGTVWGIMNSFVGISQTQTTSLAVVAPGIAEALLATAFGLFAAIPAVVIYNVFARALAAYRAQLADLGAAVLTLASRDLDRHHNAPGETRPARLYRAAE